MSWRLAKSLEVLRKQVDTAWPKRSKISDGTIGDSAHAAVPSDHNPNAAGVVTAMDITHDPAHGVDTYKLADILRTNRHPDLKYIISNKRIAGAWSNWKWQAYNGSNPHDHHMHVSVGRGDDGKSSPPYDDTKAWTIKVNQGDDDMYQGKTAKQWHDHAVAEQLAKEALQKKYDDLELAYQKASRNAESRKGVIAKVKSALGIN